MGYMVPTVFSFVPGADTKAVTGETVVDKNEEMGDEIGEIMIDENSSDGEKIEVVGWDDTPKNQRESRFFHENQQMFLPEIRCRSHLDIHLPKRSDVIREIKQPDISRKPIIKFKKFTL